MRVDGPTLKKGGETLMGKVVRCSVSLFSGGGFGDVGVEFGAGVPVIACSELLKERADVLRRLFPTAAVHCGDIWNCRDSIVNDVRARIGPEARPWLLVMSPPCQGMSSNGAGRITAAVNKGKRPDMDPRNRLLLPALDIVEALQPEWIIVENVKHMQRTDILNENDERENLISILERRLFNYDVQPRVVDAAGYGVPQRRERLITICRRKSTSTLFPFHAPYTHGAGCEKSLVTLHEATRHLGPLDALERTHDSHDPLHHVPTWTRDQYFAMAHTPEGETAFDNDMCVRCGNRSHDTSATDCEKCNAMLPRPIIRQTTWKCSECDSVVAISKKKCGNGHIRTPSAVQKTTTRVVRAFKTSYRRMHANRPASTLTTNSGVISSDVKGHPMQNRVLSLREVLIVASISSHTTFSPPWSNACTILESVPEKCLRHIAGESIPPLVLSTLVSYLDHQEKLHSTVL